MEYSSNINTASTKKSAANINVYNLPAVAKRKSIKERYLAYCDEQMKQKTVWFLVPMVSLGAAVMPAGFTLMLNFDWYIGYVAISILMFFGNLILNVADQNTRITISFYFITILFHIGSIAGSWIISGI